MKERELRKFNLKIEGISHLIMNNNSGMLDSEQVDKGVDKLAWERANMHAKLYQNSQGQLVIPANAIRKCLMGGCRFMTEKPKGNSFKSFGPLIEATCFIEEDATIDVDVSKVIEYIAIVNLNPSKGPKGPRGPRCRPMIPLPWNAETQLTLIDDAMSDDHLASIAYSAGRFVGLLDGRTIGFGRCSMTVKKMK